MNRIATYILVFFVVSSFTSKQEPVQSKNFHEIPFNFDYGVPIIKVNLNDIEYNFLFDTGMPTALSETISHSFDLRSIDSVMEMDVNGNHKRENFVVVDEILVGGVSFKDVVTLSTNLRSSFEIGCLNLDGVIGNNLIKNAVWEIDYEKKIIRLTDDIDNFKIPEDADAIRFRTNTKEGYYSPDVDVTVNNKMLKGVKFDTGSNGGIKLPLRYYLDVLDRTKSTEYYGKASVALYGKGENKIYVDSKVRSITIGDVELSDQIVTFDENYPTIGNEFLKNFKVIICYGENTIYMLKQKEYENTQLKNFGFKTDIMGTTAIVTLIFKDSEAEKKGLRLGDEIVLANEFDFSELIANDACNTLFHNPIKNLDSLNIVFSRNGTRQTLQLKKQTFIN